MSSLATSGIIFGCVFGGALLGMFLRAVLPERHLSSESKDVVKLGTGLIATMSALVLSLMIASAKSSYDTQRSELAQLSANVIMLDRVLAQYGPQTKDIREELHGIIAGALERVWPENRSQAAQVEPTTAPEEFFRKIEELSPKTEAQRSLQAQAS